MNDNFVISLKKKAFLPLFICQLLSALSDSLLRTAFVTLVTYHSIQLTSWESSIVITLSMALFTLPFCLFSAVGGQLADKFDKARLIRAIKCLNIIVTSVAALGFYYDSYWLLLSSIFLTGIQSSLFGPVKYSILPDHINKDALLMANGLIEASTFVAILIGTVWGGIIISGNSIDVSITNLVLFAISFGMIFTSFFIPKTHSADKNLQISLNPIKETWKCIQHARQYHELFLAILGISWFWLVGGIFISQMPNLTRDIFFANEKVSTLLLTLFSIGTGIGSILCNRLLRNEITLKYVPTAMILMSIFLLDLSYACTTFYARNHLGGLTYFLSSLKGLRVCIDAFLIAVCGGIYIVPLYTYLQTKSDVEVRSRTIAANNIINSIFMVIATLIASLLLAIGLAVSQLILIVALANLFTAIYVCRILPDTVIKNFFMMLFKLLYRVEIKGMENYHKAKGRVLIIANHASFLDPLLIGTILPDKLTFAIDTHIARGWWLRPFLKFLKAYPVDPTNPMSTKTFIDRLKDGKRVVIFPEGRITVTGSLMKVYEGPGLIADKADAELLPIRLDGPQFSIFSRMRGKTKIKAFPKFKITILPPQKINVDKEATGRYRRHLIGYRLYDIMSDMMFVGSKTQSTLFQSLLNAKRIYGGRRYIVDDIDRNRLTYNKLVAGAFVLGDKITKIITEKRVGILLPNASGALVTLFAVFAVHKLPAMLNFSMGINPIISSCKTARLNTVLTSKKFIQRANLQDLVQELGKEDIRIIYLEDIKKGVSIFNKLAGIKKLLCPNYYYSRNAKLENEEVPLSDDPAIILFTSGSEGAPKGVVLSHNNIQSNLQQFASRVDFNTSDKVFNCLPIFHSFGITAGTMLPLLFGMRLFFYPSPLHYRIIPEMVYGTNSTILFGTDTFLAGYAKYAHAYDFFSLRYVVCGAEKLKEQTNRVWSEKFGIRIMEGYGATETSPVISVNLPMHFKARTVGRILPNIDYILEKVEGIKEGGKLIVSGPNVMLGYLKRDNSGEIEPTHYTKEGQVMESWYDTGDIVAVDDEKYITILGRAKRFAKIAGEMVSLTQVEEVARSIWEEVNHAAINVESARKGEDIILFTEEERATKEVFISYCKRQSLSELIIPGNIIFIDTLPIIGSGKIDHTKLKQIYNDMSNK